MKSNIEHSSYNILEKIFQVYPQYQFAEDKDFEAIQKIMESNPMRIGNLVEITYSRRPDLKKSFEESKQDSLIIIDAKATSMAVLSEIPCILNGKKTKCTYSSDLRISSKSGIRFKVQFRNFYLSIVEKLPNLCLTAILKENQKAIESLTKGKGGLFYNPLVEYITRSIFISPAVKIMKNDLDNDLYKIEKASKDAFSYIEEKTKDAYFAHEITIDENSFVIKKEDKIIGFFSIQKPKYRSLLLNTNNPFIKLLIFLIQKLFGHNYNKKVPWNYLTSLILDEELKEKKIIAFILKYLYKTKSLTNGELFLLCYPSKDNLQLSNLCPQFTTSGILYYVSKNKEIHYPKGNFYINPLFL